MEQLCSQKNRIDLGYLLVPRKLLNRIVFYQKTEMSEDQSFLCMLLLVNFKDTETPAGTCRRGESLMRISEWSERFHWPVWKTRNYFKKLERLGEISIDRERYPHTIRITHYEELCANRKARSGKAPASLNDEQFDEFWETYHQITRQVPQEREAARREWNRMSMKDRVLAINMIGEYFMSQRDIRHVRKAANYLKNASYK